MRKPRYNNSGRLAAFYFILHCIFLQAERSSSEKKEKAKKPHASSQLDPAVRKRPLRPPAPTRSLRLRQTSDSKNGTGHRYEDNIKELERYGVGVC